MCTFNSIEPQSESNFPFLYTKRFQTYWPLEHVAPLVGEIDICTRGLFCTKFNSKQLLFEDFFDVMCIFGSIEPQIECNLPFQYNIIF